MVRRQFAAVSHGKRAPAHQRPIREKQMAIAHASFGPGKLVGLRPGDGGLWLADVVFGKRRLLLRLHEECFVTPADVSVLSSYIPKPAQDRARSG